MEEELPEQNEYALEWLQSSPFSPGNRLSYEGLE